MNKYNFNWDLTSKDWYITRDRKYTDRTCIGCCRVGELCFDIVPRTLKDGSGEITMTFDMFVGGEDSGYGYSKLETVHSGQYKSTEDVLPEDEYPYDECEGGVFKDSCVMMTLEEFKKMAEATFESHIEDTPFFIENASKPLHIW